MKKWIAVFAAVFVSGLFLCPMVSAGEMSSEEIIRELQALKARINTLEREHSRKDQEIERLKARVKELRGTTPPEEKQEKWTDKIQLSGVVEVEYGSEKHTVKDPVTGHSSSVRDDDLTLSTVELHTDAQINKYTKGHVVFLYEEDEDEDRVRIDEGTIRLGGIEETHNL